MILLSHPTANQFVREAVLGLEEARMLEEFWTTVSWDERSRVNHFLPNRLRAELMRRTFPAQVRSRIRTRAWREAGRLIASRIGGAGALTRHETGPFSVDAVYRDLDRTVARRVMHQPWARGVYGYEDGARDTFRAAKTRGMACIYDLPIAYCETVQRLLGEEAERWPEWEPTLGATRDSPVKLERKHEEIALADSIICPSRFVADSIPEALRSGRLVVVAEFGSPEVNTAPREPRRTEDGQRLRLLFAGSMSQRKGLADLFRAMTLLQREDVELVVMGSLAQSLEFYRKQYPHFTYEPPRPHGEVLRLMQSCDVLVLPSIVEGRALVQQEAMACGMPILVTRNAGAEDLVEEGKTGFLVPIRCPEALAEKIDWLASNREATADMGHAAQAKAKQCSWQRYRGRIIHAVTMALGAAPKGSSQ